MNQISVLFNDIGNLWSQYGGTYLGGMRRTLILALIGTVLGCLIGFMAGIIKSIPMQKNDPIWKKVILRIVRIILGVYVEVFRGTPMILQAVFIFYGLPYFTNNALQFDNKWLVSILVVSINTGAYMAESMRGGIISVDKGQTEGAMAIGMSHFQTMLSVVLPQAIRNIMPQIGNNFIINVKDTSVMFIIGFSDFFAIHKSVSGATFTYFPSATIEMAGYLFMTLASSLILRFVEKKMDGTANYKLVEQDALTMTSGNYSYVEKPKKKIKKSK